MVAVNSSKMIFNYVIVQKLFLFLTFFNNLFDYQSSS